MSNWYRRFLPDRLFQTPEADSRKQQADTPTIALVLGGGGARSAYQVGVLRYMAETFPSFRFSVLTGVSAGAINTTQLANHSGTFAQATASLARNWRNLSAGQVFDINSGIDIVRRLVADRTPEKRAQGDPQQRGLLDPSPLRTFLHSKMGTTEGELTGIQQNLRTGWLKSAAVVTTSYTTGQTVTWVQGCDFDEWERPDRVGRHTRLCVDHIMASTALPLVFPPVRINDAWYGDGGVRLMAPLAPAVHLGATHIMVIGTRHKPTQREAGTPSVYGHPPLAQIMGLLVNAVFTDALEQDIDNLQRINRLVKEKQRRNGQHEGGSSERVIDLFQLRPSVNLSSFAHEYTSELPTTLRYLTNGVGASEVRNADWLSVLLFARGYIDRVMEIGYADAQARHDEICDFIAACRR